MANILLVPRRLLILTKRLYILEMMKHSIVVPFAMNASQMQRGTYFSNKNCLYFRTLAKILSHLSFAEKTNF